MTLNIKLPKNKVTLALKQAALFHAGKWCNADLAQELYGMFKACKYSTGDVYIDAELWYLIEEWY